MKVIFILVISIFFFGCCNSRKNIKIPIVQECSSLIKQVKGSINADSLGQLVSRTLSIDKILVENKSCFIGLKESKIIEIFGRPIKLKHEKNENIYPHSLRYTYAENCFGIKACKQVFFIFKNDDEKLSDIKLLKLN